MLWRLVLATVSLACLAGLAGADDAPELTLESFHEQLNADSKPWLVKFYAPWCKHCQALAPIWEEAAAKVKDKLHMGRVDCTSHKTLCSKFGVDGYPRVLIFSDGPDKGVDYKGPRKVEDFQKLAKRLAEPPVGDFKSVEAAGKDHDVAFVLIGDESDLSAAFRDVAKAQHHQCVFGTTATGADSKYIKDGSGAGVVVVREGEVTNFDRPTDDTSLEEALAKFVAHRRFTLLPALDGYNFRDVSKTAPLTAIGVVDPAVHKPSSPFLSALKNTARKLQGRMACGWISGVEWKKFVEEYDIDIRTMPRILIVDGDMEQYLAAPPSLKKEATIQSYLEDVLSGKVQLNQGWSFMLKTIFYDWWPVFLGVFLLLILLPIVMFCMSSDTSHTKPE